jgi:hypothetical protein
MTSTLVGSGLEPSSVIVINNSLPS